MKCDRVLLLLIFLFLSAATGMLTAWNLINKPIPEGVYIKDQSASSIVLLNTDETEPVIEGQKIKHSEADTTAPISQLLPNNRLPLPLPPPFLPRP